MFSLHVLTFFFLCGNVLKKCRRDLNCSLDHSSSWVKNSIISPTKIEQHFGGFWNFETPLMLLSLSQKVAHSMRWKILFSSNIQWIPLVCMFFKIYLTLHINVQSGKIGSAWEWCHWIGKSTRAIGFYFFTSHSWIYLVYKVLSSFIKSNLLQVRFACAQTYHDWCTLVKRFCQSTALFTVCDMMEFFTHKEL